MHAIGNLEFKVLKRTKSYIYDESRLKDLVCFLSNCIIIRKSLMNKRAFYPKDVYKIVNFFIFEFTTSINMINTYLRKINIAI